MKFLVNIIIIALFAWVGSYFVAWWMVAVVPFVATFIMNPKPAKGFLLGLASIAFLWLYLILKTDVANNQILSGRIAELIGLPMVAFLIVNVVLGALVGGLGGWSGVLVRKLFK
ncbi:MAG: hypothetical protein H6551_04690 [Chitinophagales bacterium]|nr:hypothetical protein [Chitinophagaceae bacterium]MCB9064423.1 hypothetical protein [Chitinophagales bacterium]